MMNNFDINEGSITFWTKPNIINWDDSQIVNFNNFGDSTGKIVLSKTNQNKLRFVHIIEGLSETFVEANVSELNKNEKHFIAATWDTKKAKIYLYIDGEKIVKYKNIKIKS